MRSLEELICQRLESNRELTSRLALYGGSPAIFYQAAPDDSADGWRDGLQYPRLGYIVDFRANPERKTSGVLTLNITCTGDGVKPWEIEPLVRDTLCGVFLTPEGSCPYSLEWAGSEAFSGERSGKGNTDVLLVGTTVLFDVYAFPSQVTTDPDPALAMNAYVRSRFEQAVVIGDSGVPPILEPSADRPVFYFREESGETERETNTVVWLNAVLACHVFAGGQEGAWIRTLSTYLRLEGEVTMLDHSPMFMRNVRMNSAAAALSTGQMRLSVRYGLLRMYEPVPTLFRANRTFVPPNRTGG